MLSKKLPVILQLDRHRYGIYLVSVKAKILADNRIKVLSLKFKNSLINQAIMEGILLQMIMEVTMVRITQRRFQTQVTDHKSNQVKPHRPSDLIKHRMVDADQVRVILRVFRIEYSNSSMSRNS